jgi:hypothetical protein
MFTPTSSGKEDNIFITKSYDATSHFETVVDDVKDVYERIMGGSFSLFPPLPSLGQLANDRLVHLLFSIRAACPHGQAEDLRRRGGLNSSVLPHRSRSFFFLFRSFAFLVPSPTPHVMSHASYLNVNSPGRLFWVLNVCGFERFLLRLSPSSSQQYLHYPSLDIRGHPLPSP